MNCFQCFGIEEEKEQIITELFPKNKVTLDSHNNICKISKLIDGNWVKIPIEKYNTDIKDIIIGWFEIKNGAIIPTINLYEYLIHIGKNRYDNLTVEDFQNKLLSIRFKSYNDTITPYRFSFKKS